MKSSLGQTKECTVCKIPGGKEACGFTVETANRDGLTHWCRFCWRDYHQSEKGKVAVKKYQQSEKGKATLKKYRGREERKAYHKEYQQSKKGRASHRKSEKKHYREKGRARKKEDIAKVGDRYVRNSLYAKLKRFGRTHIIVTPEMMELQRQLIFLGREIRKAETRKKEEEWQITLLGTFRVKTRNDGVAKNLLN